MLCLLILKTVSSFGTQHPVTTSGFTFTPDSISANVGDTIKFNISGIHSALEVSQATWNANSNTSNGGFSVPFGGGMTVVNTVKTYYYVCGNHYAMGMKGRIVVTIPNGVNALTNTPVNFEMFPNPVSTGVTIKTNLPAGKENQIRIFDRVGKCIYQKNNISPVQYLDLSEFASGVYFVAIKSEDIFLEKKLIVSR